MKNKALLLLICLMGTCVTSYAQNNRLTVHLKQVRLGQVFELIQQQSEFIIFYKDNQVNLSQLVSVESENQIIDHVLDQALKGTGLNYKIFDRQIIIVLDKDINDADQLISQAQTVPKKKNITGKVTDETGDPIPGVTVIAKGTHFGIVTNQEGVFSLNVPQDALHLVFRLLG